MNIKNIMTGAAIGVLAASGAAHADVTLNALFMAQAAYSEDDIRNMITEFEAANPGIKVNAELVPYEALHDKIVLSQSANGYDVVLYDVIWPAEFAQYQLLEDVTSRIDDKTRSGILDGAWTTVEYDGALYGMPWIADTKFLFYNKDMLKAAGFDNPPATWEELRAQAAAIKEKGIVDYPLVWSWSQSEAAICDYTTILSGMGGEFLDADGKPAFNTGGGLKALEYMVGTLDDGLTNPNSREYLEEDVRRVFSSGQAAFALNWGYMYNLANALTESQVAGKVGIAPAPGTDGVSKASAVNGSMGLGIPTKSGHKEEALEIYPVPDLAECAGQICQAQPAGMGSILFQPGRDQRPGTVCRSGQNQPCRHGTAPDHGVLSGSLIGSARSPSECDAWFGQTG